MLRKPIIVSVGMLAALCAVASLAVGQKRRTVPSAAEVANLLDSVVQPRFEQDAGKFGLERLAVAGHEDPSSHQGAAVYNLEGNTKREKALLRAANAGGRDYAIGFVHCAHKPGRFLPPSKTNTGGASKSIDSGLGFQTLAVRRHKRNLYDLPDGVDTEEWNKRYQGIIDHIVKNALPRLKQGRNVEGTAGKWLVVMRPVHASKASCLACHRGAKPGDTLGVMVYAISASLRPTSSTHR